MKHFAQVKLALRAYDMTITRRTEGERYRVNFAGGTEATAYYTDDLDDAFGTACDMRIRRNAVRS